MQQQGAARDSDDGVGVEDSSEQVKSPHEQEEVMELGNATASISNVDKKVMDLPNDTYTMFFLCKLCGQEFWYSAYIYALKMTLLVFLYIETYGDGRAIVEWDDKKVLAAQFLLLPVAVAMQDDLISAYFIFSNVLYSPSIQEQNPYASKRKFRVSNICRCMDGLLSLAVNFLVLVSATEVLSLFLNFAALQFLQTIDNMALSLAAEGYFSDTLQDAGNRVIQAKLPKKQLRGKDLRYVDTGLFLVTVVILLILWCVITFVL